MSGDVNDGLSRLLHSIELQDIRPMAIHSESLGPSPVQGSEIQLEWIQSFADGDPLAPIPETRVFRPKYDLKAAHDGQAFFKQQSIFAVAFRVIDIPTFDEVWMDGDIRKAFMERQLQRTMWPLFRQHVHDGMSRLGMVPVPLPWLM